MDVDAGVEQLLVWILRELQKINLQLALMNDNVIEDDDILGE